MPIVPATSQVKAIRAAVVARLKGSTRAGDRVYPNRMEAWEETSELPAIGVYTRGEVGRLFNEAPREYQRDAGITLELLVGREGTVKPDDELGSFVQEVLRLVFLDESAADQAARSWYEGHDIAVNTEGKRPVLAARAVVATTNSNVVPSRFRFFMSIPSCPGSGSNGAPAISCQIRRCPGCRRGRGSRWGRPRSRAGSGT